VKAKSNSTIDVHNPATLAPLDSVPSCGEADVNAAVRAAKEAQLAWWRTSGVEKAELMHEVAQRIRAKKKDIGTLMTQETGKPLVEAIDCVKWVAESLTITPSWPFAAQGPVVAPRRSPGQPVRKEPYAWVARIAPPTSR
jgi:acyl-CoA reductase-like NAD-dependent aldehyde dehydrogenase